MRCIIRMFVLYVEVDARIEREIAGTLFLLKAGT